MFHFKQFSVDQSGCAMKINTDGVLLGALIKADNPATILDIGTGTGVITLMLAQRFTEAKIDAIEIDEIAAKTASLNFTNSPFNERLTVYPDSFQDFFNNHEGKKYDLIISNPPFHIYSLRSPGLNKALAKHTDESFFEKLIREIAGHLTTQGQCCLILPLQTAILVKELMNQHSLYLHKIISIHSFEDAEPHREILVIGMEQDSLPQEKFVIYSGVKKYSREYSEVLKNFLTIF